MTATTRPSGKDFQNILALVRAAVDAGVSLIQLREKSLTARTLFELTLRSAAITRGTNTRLLVNDRADVAVAAAADGVHLTTRSIKADVIRRTFGTDFLIGVSTHSLMEAREARDRCADFAVFGPIFATPSKHLYGPPVGIEKLREAAHEVSPFPLVALGGITREKAVETLRAGASGVAGISLFSSVENLSATVRAIRDAPIIQT